MDAGNESARAALTRHALVDGRTATTVTLRAACGVAVSIADLGAMLTRIVAPDRDGHGGDVLLRYPTIADYPAAGAPGGDAYLGATCGRIANRIAGASFVLDGRRWPLAANEGANQLHGGACGFSRVLWSVVDVDVRTVTLRHVSGDGDQGYPGELCAIAMFTLDDDGVLTIRYTAETSAPTHVNLVSHGYFNLSGDPTATILDHRLGIAADGFLEIDDAALPTGMRRPVHGTPFDFTVPRAIGEAIAVSDPQLARGDGYNHNFILRRAGLREVARVEHPASGRTLTVTTDQPGLQFYSGNALGPPFGRRTGLCLETQAWPDSANHPDFPSTRLDPGQVYRSETRLTFGCG